MAASTIDSTLFRDQFSTPAMRAVFDDKMTVQKWLDVEAALARAESFLGIIPEQAARDITRAADVEQYDLDAMRGEMARTSHPIVPLVRAGNMWSGRLRLRTATDVTDDTDDTDEAGATASAPDVRPGPMGSAFAAVVVPQLAPVDADITHASMLLALRHGTEREDDRGEGQSLHGEYPPVRFTVAAEPPRRQTASLGTRRKGSRNQTCHT